VQLIRYEAARTALAAAHSVDEVKDIRDKAEAMAAYARQAKDSELIQYATEIKVRAERRCGEMLRTTEKNTGARMNGSVVERCDHRETPTLADMGLSKDESSRYQQLAAMPDEHFETAVATAKATAGEVTTAHMLRIAKEGVPSKRPREDRVAEMRELARQGHSAEQIAAAQGLGLDRTQLLLREADIKISIQRRGRSINAKKIVLESVAALSGIAQGLALVSSDVDIDQGEAADLLSELRASMKSLRALETTLKEIVNGK
jgi:hypothetical protein